MLVNISGQIYAISLIPWYEFEYCILLFPPDLSSLCRDYRTKAFAYVPSTPNKATGGFESASAAAAYVLRVVRGAVRRAAASTGRANLWDIILPDIQKRRRGRVTEFKLDLSGESLLIELRKVAGLRCKAGIEASLIGTAMRPRSITSRDATW